MTKAEIKSIMKALIFAIVFIIAPAIACNQPITKVGKTCPLGYYTSNGYCIKS
jgi:hypothetical protein